MRIITPKGTTVDTEKESVVLMFNDDNELSSVSPVANYSKVEQ